MLCLISPICAKTAAIELYTPQGAEMVSGMIYDFMSLMRRGNNEGALSISLVDTYYCYCMCSTSLLAGLFVIFLWISSILGVSRFTDGGTPRECHEQPGQLGE